MLQIIPRGELPSASTAQIRPPASKVTSTQHPAEQIPQMARFFSDMKVFVASARVPVKDGTTSAGGLTSSVISRKK